MSMYRVTATLRLGAAAAKALFWLAVVAVLATAAMADQPVQARAKLHRPTHSSGTKLQSETAAAVTSGIAEPFPADVAVKTELNVGALHAAIAVNDASSTLAVGSSAVVTVSITDAGGNRFVTLLAEADGGLIRSISGPGIATSPVRGGLAAEISLPASGGVSATVEFEAKAGHKDPSGFAHDRVRITLLPQKGGRDESIIGWQLSDCAGEYHAELQKVLQDQRPAMTGTLDAAMAKDPALPSTWYFPPSKSAMAASCKPHKGKKPVACVSQAAVGSPAPDEARILDLANQVLHDKGALPAYQHRTGALRQVSYTLLNGLRNYLEQSAHPALCSGVDAMLDYYKAHTPTLRSMIADSKQALATAQSMAAAKVAELTRVAAAQTPVVRPSSGGSGLVSVAMAAESPQAVSLIAANQADLVGRVVLRPADANALANDQDVFAKLQRLRGFLNGEATSDLPVERRSAALSALGMIEAGLYLDAAASKYGRIDNSIYGTMSAIKQAHAKACVCAQ